MTQRLTRLEAALLHWLQQNPGKCLSRQFLLQTVWGYQDGVRSRTLDVHIRRLRAKLGPQGRERIKTIFRDGYCWYPGDERTAAGAAEADRAPGTRVA